MAPTAACPEVTCSSHLLGLLTELTAQHRALRTQPHLLFALWGHHVSLLCLPLSSLCLALLSPRAHQVLRTRTFQGLTSTLLFLGQGCFFFLVVLRHFSCSCNIFQPVLFGVTCMQSSPLSFPIEGLGPQEAAVAVNVVTAQLGADAEPCWPVLLLTARSADMW